MPLSSLQRHLDFSVLSINTNETICFLSSCQSCDVGGERIIIGFILIFLIESNRHGLIHFRYVYGIIEKNIYG